jgi:hypothetical protein
LIQQRCACRGSEYSDPGGFEQDVTEVLAARDAENRHGQYVQPKDDQDPAVASAPGFAAESPAFGEAL